VTYKLTAEIISPGCSDFLTGFASINGNPSGDAHKVANNLVGVITQGASGHSPMHLRVRLDNSVPTMASATVAITYASIAAADILTLNDPAIGQVAFTCVSTTPNAGDNTFQKTVDASTTGASLAACINTSPQTRGRYTAANASGTVTISQTAGSGLDGAMGNTVFLTKQMANGAGMTLSAFTGGRDAGSTQTLQATLGANPTNGQTFLIGAKTITFATSAANQDQVTIGANATATATALVAVLNANTDLAGYFVATSTGAGVLTVELRQAGQIGRFISVGGTATSLAWVNAQTQASATDFRPTTTETNQVLTQGLTLGLRASAS